MEENNPKEVRKIKTYKDWEGRLEEYLNVGDEIDEEMYNHFLNVLPPAYWNNGILQVGEPADTFGGKFTFSTFTKVNNRFFYKGECYRGETENLTA